MVRKRIRFGAMAIFLAGCFLQRAAVAFAGPAPQSGAPADQARLTALTERFLRRALCLGPGCGDQGRSAGAFQVGFFYLLPIEVTLNGQTEMGEVYVSKDGKTLLQGEVFDIAADPFATNRGKLHIEGNPSLGPADAPVTLVEFADFQCPHCRELYESLKAIEMKYPQVRVVYKDFPLNSIHPWADTAAVGRGARLSNRPTLFGRYTT